MFTEEDDPKGNRAAATTLTVVQEMKLIDFLRDNKILYNKCLMTTKTTINGRNYIRELDEKRMPLSIVKTIYEKLTHMPRPSGQAKPI